MEFVRHYTTRHDSPLPTVVAIATLPIVLADGGILGEERGLDEERGISFIIPAEVMALLPKGEVTDEAVAREMKFLTDEWLCDVATDYAGKCVIIAAALSIIERSLLDSRPTFFVTAGRRGSGKTTVLIMLIKAVTGIWPAAAAWSSNEEERRKAIMSYFLAGVPYILWDNIPRGTQIRVRISSVAARRRSISIAASGSARRSGRRRARSICSPATPSAPRATWPRAA